MDAKFVPVDQMYNLVVVEDNNNNRIGQWTNISSTGWILQLSHELNPEAQIGMYTLKAFIGDRTISHVFEVKKYVLPKFDVTVNAPQTYSVADVGLKVEACAKYTYGQPVPGRALVEVCREPFPYAVVPELTRWCLNQTAEMNDTGCASLTVDTSVFFYTNFENNMKDALLVKVNVTEEGTDVLTSKSATVYITFEVGKVTFVDLPDYFEPGSTIKGKISVSRFDGTPIANKVVYLLDGNSWPNKLLQNLTTNQKGLASFSLSTASLPKAALNLVASATPAVVSGYKSPYFTTDTRVVQLLQPASPNNPSSELTIVKLEQPLKCGAVFPVTVKYSFVGEAGDYSVDIIYMVLSRGLIVLHGFQTVTATASNTVTSGSVSFQLSVSVDMAPVVQILVYGVLPSENVVVGSASFETETCLQNQVFDLLPVRSLSGYPNSVQDEPQCLGIRPRQALRMNPPYTAPANQAYTTFKVENAVRQGKTGMACTDVQRKWNSGAKKNVGMRKVKNINFNHHRPYHIYPGTSTMQESTMPPQLFKNHREFIVHSNSSVMAPLFQLQTNGLIQLSYKADVDSNKAGHSKHDPTHSNTLSY
ncbi:unnamed protein product [Leuciscus chuanchicus]